MRRNIISDDNSQTSNNMGWLTTFNDLVTLLMVFFVLVFTMSSIDAIKLKDFQTSLQSGLGVLEAGKKLSIGVINSPAPPEDQESVGTSAETTAAPQQDEVLTRMEKTLTSLESEYGIKAGFVKKGVLISLEDSILFDLGKAEVNAEGYSVLDRIAAVIKSTQNTVRIEGHTDSIPIGTRRFPSNWELSAARAVQVLKYFIEIGRIRPQRLSAVGYGESRPICSQDTPECRAKNRRVEIILITEDGD